MENTLEFVIRHGYLVLFVWVLAEQLGLPLPAIPILLAAGALAGKGELDWTVIIALSTVAALMSDLTWYELGRRRGGSLLHMLCRISLEPDSCVRRTENVFARHGARTLLVAKFLPGLSTAAPPMAGMFGMSLTRFLVFDGLGTLLWAVGWTGLGYIFSTQLERAVSYAAGFGAAAGVALVAGLAAYLGGKYFQRVRMIRRMRVARITPVEVKRMMEAGEDVFIVDLRHSVDVAANPVILPGALHLPVEEFEARHGEIPREREIVLYCS